MKLKLMAPFATRGFGLRAARIIQEPDAYEAAWDAAAAADPAAALRDGGAGIGGATVEALRFTHASTYSGRAGSRYRTIDTHALPRPLHALELIVRPSADRMIDWIGAGARAVAASPAGALPGEVNAVGRDIAEAVAAAARPPGALVRVHDHGVALLELDLPLPPALAAGPEDAGPHGIGRTLDALQQLGIAVAETVVDAVAADVLPRLVDWLHGQPPLRDRFLRPRADGSAPPAGATFWVTRSLILEAADGFGAGPPAEDGSGDERRAALASHWLKDVDDAGVEARRCATDPAASCTSWLNYFFGEASYAGPYPADGWREAADGRERALPFSPEWDAMLIAQFYYAAFDRLQTKISRILAVSVAGENRRSVAVVKADLDGAIRDAHMLSVDYEENRKYYARRVGAMVTAILDGWGFEDGIRGQVAQRIRDCSRRLNELHSRAIERSGVYTDLILIAIGVTAVFEVLLFLSMYGRTMSADPYLQGYDRTSRFNIAEWIGGSSTDVVLLAGSFFSLGLVFLYVFVRTSRSKV